MRITDDRYSRDRLRFDLALRFIHHEARTHTIRAWTGLSDDRIRKLYRSYLRESGSNTPPRRRRGKSPRQAGFFTRSLRMQQETAILASLCCLHEVLEPGGTPPPRAHGYDGVARGELLCRAFEAYIACVPGAQISFEHAVFLVGALGRGDEIDLASCIGCDSLTIRDRLSLRETRCAHCGERAEPAPRSLTAARRLPLARLASFATQAASERSAGR